jgi:hypothetical protein
MPHFSSSPLVGNIPTAPQAMSMSNAPSSGIGQWLPSQPRLLVAAVALPIGGMVLSGWWNRPAVDTWYKTMKKPK